MSQYKIKIEEGALYSGIRSDYHKYFCAVEEYRLNVQDEWVYVERYPIGGGAYIWLLKVKARRLIKRRSGLGRDPRTFVFDSRGKKIE